MKRFYDFLLRDFKRIFLRADGKIKKFKIIILSIIILMFVWGIMENNIITVREFEISSPNLPSSFSGYRIAHISDLHNKEFGRDNRRLLEKLRGTEPDIIVITGDIVDSTKTDTEVALEFCSGAVKIAPTYYVTGNHESAVSKYNAFARSMEALGVIILKNEAELLEKDGEKIILAGIDDPMFGQINEAKIAKIIGNDGYRILLSHRPELFSSYVSSGVDLVFTGHAHGGQFRIPFIGGIVAPNQGIFPEYDSGLYTEGTTNMLVSRGLGNSIIPIRINNAPEIIVAELKKGQ